MRIEVTQKDIDQGEPLDCERCPVARAILRTSGVQCKVTTRRIERPDGGWIKTPFDLCSSIWRIDSGSAAVRPFAFELPDDFLRARP